MKGNAFITEAILSCSRICCVTKYGKVFQEIVSKDFIRYLPKKVKYRLLHSLDLLRLGGWIFVSKWSGYPFSGESLRSERDFSRKSQTTNSKCLSYFNYLLLNRTSNITKVTATITMQDGKFASSARIRSMKSTELWLLFSEPSWWIFRFTFDDCVCWGMHVTSQWPCKHSKCANSGNKEAFWRQSRTCVHFRDYGMVRNN